jgi:LacI family transcriptional regulator
MSIPKLSTTITLRDVASAAGVTLATASRSLNNAYGVHADTRARVMQIAARLNYKPNRFARGLVTGRSNMVGLIISDVRNSYFAEVARGAEDAAYAAGRDLMLCNSDLDSAKQMRYISSLMEKRVEGIIMNSVSALTREEQAYLAESGVPVVLLNRHTRGAAFSTVCADNEVGGKLVAECFLRHGHTKLVHFTGPKRHANLAQRGHGFMRAIDRSADGAEASVVHGVHTVTGGYEMASSLFADLGDITGIFAANDAVAFGVIRAAIEKKVRIPEDVSLIGFDDVELAALVHPPLTTLQQSKYEIGAAAVEILLRRSSGEQRAPEHRVLPVELIERASVARPRKT